MKSQTISLREFARRMSVTDKTIRDGIKNKKIVRGLITENGKHQIIYEIAAKEFEESGLGHRARLKQEEPTPPPAKKTQKERQPAKQENSETEELSENTTLATANRLERIYKARKAKAEAEVLEGTLVNKQEVYLHLFEFGRQIRKEFETLKTRLSPVLLECGSDKMKIDEAIDKSVYESLSKLIDNLSEKKLC